MALAQRPVVFALLAGFVLLAAGCSDNKNKIVGRWKASSDQAEPSNMPAEAGMFFEFTADSQFRAYMSAGGKTIDLAKGRYRLGAGSAVYLTDLSPAMSGKTRTKEKITITGNTMSIAGEDGKTITLTRVP